MRYLVTTLSRYYVYFLHDAFCLLENVDDLLVVFYILEAEGEAFTVFEPFLGWLIASYIEVPGGFWYTFKILVAVDVNAILLPAMGLYSERKSS